MSTKKKGQTTVCKEWWQHLRKYKRFFWKRERAKTKELINSDRESEIGEK